MQGAMTAFAAGMRQAFLPVATVSPLLSFQIRFGSRASSKKASSLAGVAKNESRMTIALWRFARLATATRQTLIQQ
jgi:hypothetical protein